MILVIAHNIIQGGGINIVCSFLEFLTKNKKESIAILPDLPVYRELEASLALTFPLWIIWAPSDISRYLYKLKFPHLISAIIKKNKISLIYSLGNIGYKADVPQTVLVQNAFSTLADKRIWRKFSFFDRAYLMLMQFSILKNLKYASKVLVQTNTQKIALQIRLKIEENKISVVPNHVDLSKIGLLSKQNVIFDGSCLNLLFLSKYYAHKNFEILPEVCRLIREKKLPVRITLTLNGNNKSQNKILKNLKAYDDIITNIGHLRYNELSAIYSKHHAILLPTLLESFSGNYIEAMYFNKIIFTSDKDFAREVCGNVANYFDPWSAVEIVNSFQYALENPQSINMKKEYYKNQIEKLNILDSNLNNQIIFNSIPC